jgi:hypothetical protein
LITFSGNHLFVDTYSGDNKHTPKKLLKFNFVAAGDFGCGDEPDRTINGMIKKIPES